MRPIELPPPRAQDARETERTEPGTWREIIARFERELGPLTDPDDQRDDAADAIEAAVYPDAPETLDVPVEADAADDLQAGDTDAPAAPGSTVDTDAPDAAASSAGAAASPADAERLTPDTTREPATIDNAATDSPGVGAPDSDERVLPGEPTYFDEPMPWEVAAMTTPGYMPPPSIHDEQHDGWPVDAEDGDTVPAWSDETEADAGTSPDAEAYGDINELLLDEEVPADPWDVEPEPDEADSRSDFPLDAFIVPAGVHHMPTGYDAAVAQRVAHRLDEMARRLRDGGLATLGSTDSVDELSRVLAAIVTGYVAHTD